MSDATIHSSSNYSRIAQTDSTAALKQAAQPKTSGGNEAGKPFLVKADQASLSVASGLITKALSGSDVRADKVASLQKSIAAGTYSVSSSDVAGKLLQSLLGE